MVRSEEAIRRKASISSHATEFDWNQILRQWDLAGRRPIQTLIRSASRPAFEHYRLTRLPKPYGADLVAHETSAGEPVALRSIERLQQGPP